MPSDVFDRFLDELAERVAARLRPAGALAPAPAPTVPRHVTTAQAAEALACTPGHIRELVRRGRLRAVADGRRLLIPAEAIEEYLSAPAPRDKTPTVDELLARRRRP